MRREKVLEEIVINFGDLCKGQFCASELVNDNPTCLIRKGYYRDNCKYKREDHFEPHVYCTYKK